MWKNYKQEEKKQEGKKRMRGRGKMEAGQREGNRGRIQGLKGRRKKELEGSKKSMKELFFP